MALIFNHLMGAFLPELPLDLFSTQGVMVMLLAAYAVAMWMFLTSAPKVYTVMVSDLAIAKQFYEGMLELPVADVPLHYYYNYEQTLGGAADPMYLSSGMGRSPNYGQNSGIAEGLWYQLLKNTQIHVISGANFGDNNRHRHVCFDKDCLEQILLRVQMYGVKYKIRQEKPLIFLVKDWDGRVLEMAEMQN